MMEVGPCNHTAIIVHGKSTWNQIVVGPDKPAIPGGLFCACSMYIVVLFSRECHPVYIHKVHQNGVVL